MSLDTALKAQDSNSFNPPHQEFDKDAYKEKLEAILDDITDDSERITEIAINSDAVLSSLYAMYLAYELDHSDAITSHAKSICSVISRKVKQIAEGKV